MSDGTPFLRVVADRIGAPGSPARNAIPRHQRRQLVLNHPDRREDGRHSKANCTSSRFQSHSMGWEGSIWGIPVYTSAEFEERRAAWAGFLTRLLQEPHVALLGSLHRE